MKDQKRIEALIRRSMKKFGVPAVIKTDNGKSYTGKASTAFLKF